MNARRMLAVALVLVLAATVGGCAKAASLVPTRTAEAKEPTVAAAFAPVTGELPVGIPEGLPLWPGAEILSSKDDESAFDLVLGTDDAVGDIVPGLATGFERAGWSVASSGEDAVSSTLTVSNSAYEGIVSVYEGDGVNTIEYLLTPIR